MTDVRLMSNTGRQDERGNVRVASSMRARPEKLLRTNFFYPKCASSVEDMFRVDKLRRGVSY
jgi:hypothetical protein